MEKIMKKFLLAGIALLCGVLFFSCTNGTRTSVDVNSGWKLALRDNMEFARPDYDDSSWDKAESSGPIVFGTVGDNYCWIRKTVEIPRSLSNDDVYLGFGKGNYAVAVYADGVYVGSRGNLPPDYNMRIENACDILIPKSCIHNGSVVLALRIYAMETDVDDLELTLDSPTQAYFQNKIHNIFNQRIFLLMAVVCLFMAVYSLAQYISSRDIAYLMYSICVIFVMYYFYDMGCEIPLIKYTVHRVLTRASLTISMGFLALYLAAFFKRNYFKKMLPVVLVFDVVVLILYMVNVGKNSVVNNLFTILLIPTFAVIIYGYVIIIRAAKKKMFGSTQLIVGFIGGSIFAISDIVAQVRGVSPFVWTQGIAFFSIDMAIFVALLNRDGKNQKRVERLAKKTTDQKDKLSNVFQNAMTVAGETAEISRSLADSVNTVNVAVDSTQDKVEEIKKALDIQGESQQETAKAVTNLTSFLGSMRQQFEKQSLLIESTANRINDVIHGIQSVGDGVSSAAEFSRGLSGITSGSSGDMKKLLDEMEKVQDSSQEILGVVTTLDNFAQQTNLLAMNASIEAAHSGESGKGFAVIAREIKDLASQTSQWSAKIGEIITVVISQIQHSVELCMKVNESLSKINTDSQESAKKVGAASQSVMEQQREGEIIAKESADLAAIAKKMQNALAEQEEFAEQVNKNMEALFNASKDVDNASHEIYNEAKSLSDESKNLINLAKRTRESSESLNTIMAQHENSQNQN